MADENTATRVETVAANLAAVVEQRGAEAWNYIYAQHLKDISESLAMLVDAGTTAEGD